MNGSAGATIHASAVLVGRRAAILQGPAGSGKSRLALALIRAAELHLLSFARLVGDDRIQVQAVHGSLLVRPSPSLAGLIEVRGLGIRRLPYEPVAAAGLVVDLGAPSERMPEPSSRTTMLLGVSLPRLAIAAEADALAMILALMRTVELET